MSEAVVDNLLCDLENAYSRIEDLENQREYTLRYLERNECGGEIGSLSKEFEIPLKIAGLAITEGTWNGVTYTKEQLQSGMNTLEGMPLTVDHPVDFKDKELGVMDEVGKVDRIYWDDEKNGISFEGSIVDEDVARRVYHGMVDTVSIGVNIGNKRQENGKTLAEDLKFLELSLVKRPACEDAKFEVLRKKVLTDGEPHELDDKEVKTYMSDEQESQESTSKEELVEVLVTEDTAEDLKSEDKLYKYPYKYPYYKYPYPYKYPYYKYPEKGEEEDAEDTLKSILDRLETLEEGFKELSEIMSEKEETKEESTEEASEDEESKEDLKEEIKELKSKISELEESDEPEDRVSEETGEASGEDALDVDSLSSKDRHRVYAEFLKTQG